MNMLLAVTLVMLSVGQCCFRSTTAEISESKLKKGLQARGDKTAPSDPKSVNGDVNVGIMGNKTVVFEKHMQYMNAERRCNCIPSKMVRTMSQRYNYRFSSQTKVVSDLRKQMKRQSLFIKQVQRRLSDNQSKLNKVLGILLPGDAHTVNNWGCYYKPEENPNLIFTNLTSPGRYDKVKGVYRYTNGDKMTARCKQGGEYRFHGSNTLTCVNGRWKGNEETFPKCQWLPEIKDYSSATLFASRVSYRVEGDTDHVRVKDNGTVTIPSGTRLTLDCMFPQTYASRTGNPKWQRVDVKGNKHLLPTGGWYNSEGIEAFRVTVEPTTPALSGTYQCTNPVSGLSNGITISVNRQGPTTTPIASTTTRLSIKGKPCLHPDFLGVRITFKGKLLQQVKRQRFQHGTVLPSRCEEIGLYHFQGSHRLTCSDGNWLGAPKCSRIQGGSMYGRSPINFKVQKSSMQISDDGRLLVKKRADVTLYCMACEWCAKLKTGDPIWRKDKSRLSGTWSTVPMEPSGGFMNVRLSRKRAYKLEIRDARPGLDSGVYSCENAFVRLRQAIPITVLP